MRKILILLSLSFILCKTWAQKSAENQLGTWYMYNGSHQLSNTYSLKTSAHVRYFELTSNYQQEIYRIGLNYRLHDKINFTAGTVYSITDTSYSENEPDLYEFRFYQDANFKDTWGKFEVTHRVRLAQRFTQENSKKETKHRIRYGLFLNYPLLSSLKIYAFNEVFIKFAQQSFGQNRTGLGIVQQINKQLRVRLGYMHTLFNDTTSHRLQMGVILNTIHKK